MVISFISADLRTRAYGFNVPIIVISCSLVEICSIQVFVENSLSRDDDLIKHVMRCELHNYVIKHKQTEL